MLQVQIKLNMLKMFYACFVVYRSIYRINWILTRKEIGKTNCLAWETSLLIFLSKAEAKINKP